MSLFSNTILADSPPLRAVIAFSSETEGLSTAIIWCTPGLRNDLKENGCDPDDCFESDKGPGIFIWEGHIRGIVYPSTPDHAEEYDVEYDGTLRPPTDAEWQSIRAGISPWEAGS